MFTTRVVDIVAAAAVTSPRGYGAAQAKKIATGLSILLSTATAVHGKAKRRGSWFRCAYRDAYVYKYIIVIYACSS